MRVLHVIGGLNRGGAETWIVQVLRHIDRTQYQFDFLVHSTEPGAYDDEVRALGSRIIPCLSPSKPIAYGMNFLRLLREFGPYDCVHSHVHHFSGYTMLLASLAGVKVRIAHSHTAHLESAVPFSRRTYLRLMKVLVRQFATCGIAVNREAAQSLFPAGWEMDSRWQTCPIGIDLAAFEINPDKASVRKRLGIPPGALVIGHVGRFVEAKNHAFLIEIVKCLCQMRNDVYLLCIGDGPLRSAIEDLAKQNGILDNIIFTGNSSEIPILLKGVVDVFVFPSVYEGMPLALLEAQAAGLPCVVSTNVPDAACIANGTRREKLIAGAEYWATTIHRAAAQPREAVLPRDLEEYSVEKSTNKLNLLYSSLIA